MATPNGSAKYRWRRSICAILEEKLAVSLKRHETDTKLRERLIDKEVYAFYR